MEALGAAANVFAAASIADQIAGHIKDLYEFWSAVIDAPAKIQAIISDLKLVSNIIAQIANHCQSVAHNDNSGLDALTRDVLKSCEISNSCVLRGTNGMRFRLGSSHYFVQDYK
jgi:hypothetical protein